MTNRLPVHLNGFLGPNHAIDPIKSLIIHDDAKAFGHAEKFFLLSSLVPDVDPNARPRLEWNPLNTSTRLPMYSGTESSLPSSLALVP